MKKYLVILGAAILVTALVSPAGAQDDWAKKFKSSSLFQIWSVWEKNYDFDNASGTSATSTGEKTRRGISSRVNFYLEYGDAKFVRGVVGFEMDSTNWGESTWDNTGATANPTGRYGVAGTDQAQLEIKHAYLQFTVPTTPVMVSIGAQGFGVGGRLVQSRDIPGIIVSANFAPHSIRALWWRENETDRTTYQINDTYGLEWKMAQKLFDVYAYFLYKNDLATAAYKDHPYWIGVGGGYRPGNFSFSGQFVYVGGERDYVAAATTDQDYKAWAAELLAQYQIGPGLSVAAEGFYATGSDPNKTDEITAYTRPTGSESHANFGLGRTVIFWMDFSQFGNQHNLQSDFGGFWYGRLNAQFAPLPWLNLSGNYLYIGDTAKNANSIGRTDKDEDYVGSEVNLIATLRIQKNFTYNIGVGYFFPGAVLDNAGRDAEGCYAINTGMQLAF